MCVRLAGHGEPALWNDGNEYGHDGSADANDGYTNGGPTHVHDDASHGHDASSADYDGSSHVHDANDVHGASSSTLSWSSPNVSDHVAARSLWHDDDGGQQNGAR